MAVHRLKPEVLGRLPIPSLAPQALLLFLS